MSDERPPKAPEQGRSWFRVLAVLFTASCAFLGAGAATCAYHTLTPSPRSEASATVVRGTSTIVLAIRDLATLETSSYHMERVIDLRDRQSRMFGLVESEDAILLVAVGDVVAGVDLTTMRDGDVSFDPDKRVAYITLPRANVLSARLDNEQTYVHSRNTDTLAERADTLETRARQEAERSLKEGALAAGILERANKNAVRAIETLVRGLGYARVETRFREE